MEYVGLGKSNLMVSRVGLGAQSLNEIDTDENAAILIHKAYDAGVNFFDISHSENGNVALLYNRIKGY